MKTKTLFLSVMAVLTLAACQKENDGMMHLTIEGMGGDSKMAVQDSLSYWATGDQVRINSTTATIDIGTSGSTATTTVGVDAADAYYGVYPASVYSGNSGASYTLDLPSTYTYATTTRHGRTYQNLQEPMVGYTTSSDMMFKHVTAAINVQVVNYHYDYAIVVDTIEVSSATYKLCGETNVVIESSNNISVAAVTASVDSTKKITMLFNGGPSLQVAANSSATVQIPVLPVGSDNKFTVKISVHRADDATVKATLVRTQATGGNLDRAKLGYARYTLGGPFSVSSSKKVVFSSGNLQYKASGDEWRFAPYQYSYIGNAVGNTTAASDRDTQDDWIDLFGWGTGNNPTMVSTSVGDYASFSDWGTAASEDIGSGWYTLTKDEWLYLTTGLRSTSTYGLPTATDSQQAKFVKGTVQSVNGLIIFPDNYTQPNGVQITQNTTYNGTGAGYTQFKINSGWEKMELSGAVFMPAAGYRNGVGVSNASSQGYYWSNTSYNTNFSYMVNISSYGMNPQNNYTGNKYYGYSVRLVHDVD